MYIVAGTMQKPEEALPYSTFWQTIAFSNIYVWTQDLSNNAEHSYKNFVFTFPQSAA